MLPTKTRLVASSIAIGVLRLIAVFVAIFSAVTVIAVVILPTRIRIEPLILVRVVASLADSILIAGSIADIAVVPIVRLVVDVAAAVIPATIPIFVTISPADTGGPATLS